MILSLITLIFLKRFSTLHDLLFDLLDEEISINKAVKEQNEMMIKIQELRDFILLEEKDIKNKNTLGIIRKTEANTQIFFFFQNKKVCIKAV